MSDRRRQQLEEQYQDAALALLMDDYADAAGKRLLSAYEKEQEQGNVREIPAEQDKRLRKLIGRSFARKAGRRLLRSACVTVTRGSSVMLCLLLVLGLTVMSVDSLREPVLGYLNSHPDERGPVMLETMAVPAQSEPVEESTAPEKQNHSTSETNADGEPVEGMDREKYVFVSTETTPPIDDRGMNKFKVVRGQVVRNHSYSKLNQGDEVYHERTCSRCGDVWRETHDWDEGTVTRESTCATEGILTYSCTECGRTRTEALEKSAAHIYTHDCDVDCDVCGQIRTIEHSFPDAWSWDESSHWHQCECEQRADEAEHTWNEGIRNVDGTMHYTCSVCLAEKTEGEPKESFPWWIVLTALVVGIGVGVVAVRGSKEDERRKR